MLNVNDGAQNIVFFFGLFLESAVGSLRTEKRRRDDVAKFGATLTALSYHFYRKLICVVCFG